MAFYVPAQENGRFDFDFSDGKGRRFAYYYIVPLMIGLKIHNRDLYEEFINGKNSEPLIKFLDGLERRRFESLLSNRETFDAKVENRTTVRIEDKLNQVYTAIFNTDYTNIGYVSVGEYSFEKSSRKDICDIVNLLSNYTNL
jgi:hypothetical protein